MPNTHQTYMQMALRAAKRGGRSVRPNPLVGCVLVKKNQVISSGYHSFYGGPHAEVNALKKIGSKARGATAYLTLEPCVHWGKTPPCAPQLINAGIRKVFVAMTDPNPKNHGKGIQFLKRHGCSVEVGLGQEEANELNRPFKTWILGKRPYVILKMAQSLDGKIATRSGDSKWVSSAESRKSVHQLRAECDAVIIGVQTALLDNPALTSHGQGRNPLRVILDPHHRTRRSLKIFKDDAAPTLIVTGGKSKTNDTLSIPSRNGSLDLHFLMKHLFSQGVYQVLVEGGGVTAWNFLAAKLIDEVRFYVAPKIVGGEKSITSVEGLGIAKMMSAIPVNEMSVTSIGSDLLLRGYVN